MFSTGVGDALCDSRHPDAQRSFEVASEYCLEVYGRLPYDRREVQRNKDNTNKAIRFVIHHPGDEARLWFWRGFYSYRDDHDALVAINADRGHPLHDSRFEPVLVNLADAYYYLAGALSLLGVATFWGRRHPKRFFLLLLGAGTALLPFILFGDPRYHVPVLPFLAAGAAATVSALRLGWRRQVFATTEVVDVRPQECEAPLPRPS